MYTQQTNMLWPDPGQEDRVSRGESRPLADWFVRQYLVASCITISTDSVGAAIVIHNEALYAGRSSPHPNSAGQLLVWVDSHGFNSIGILRFAWNH